MNKQFFWGTSHKTGISLITLVITIIVIIILAGAVILSLFNTNIIGNANNAVKAQLKESVVSSFNLALMGNILNREFGNPITDITMSDIAKDLSVEESYLIDKGFTIQDNELKLNGELIASENMSNKMQTGKIHVTTPSNGKIEIKVNDIIKTDNIVEYKIDDVVKIKFIPDDGYTISNYVCDFIAGFIPANEEKSVTMRFLTSYNLSVIYNKGIDLTNLSPENIKTGVNINGVVGTFTSDATSSENDIIKNKIGYSNGIRLVGMLNLDNLISENIKKGITINGVTGNLESTSKIAVMRYCDKGNTNVISSITLPEGAVVESAVLFAMGAYSGLGYSSTATLKGGTTSASTTIGNVTSIGGNGAYTAHIGSQVYDLKNTNYRYFSITASGAETASGAFAVIQYSIP